LKKITLLLFLNLFNYSFSQSHEADLFLNDGTTIEGYGMIYKQNQIKFRTSLEDESDIWTHSLVKSIIIYSAEIDAKFEYVKLEPNGQVKLLQVICEGRVNLYAERIKRSIFIGFNDISGYSNTKITDYENTRFYLKRLTENFPTRLSGNFKKKSKKYFSDCLKILEKVKV